MGKVSMTDKMRMQRLHEQGFGAKAIIAAYPDKQWKLICRCADEMGSALERRKGSERPKSVHTPTNIDCVDELICSQGSNIGKHLSTQRISAELNISRTFFVTFCCFNNNNNNENLI